MAITRALAAEGAQVVAGFSYRRHSERAGSRHRLDVLFDNVIAVRIRADGFLATSDEEFEWALQMNFFTTLRTTRAAGPMTVVDDGLIKTT